MPNTYGNSVAWVAPTRAARSIGVAWSKRYTQVGECRLCASAIHRHGIRKAASLETASTPLVFDQSGYAEMMSATRIAGRFGWSAAIAVNIWFTASEVTGMIGDRDRRNNDASSLLVPMISGIRCANPFRKAETGYRGTRSPSTTGAIARVPGTEVETVPSSMSPAAIRSSTGSSKSRSASAASTPTSSRYRAATLAARSAPYTDVAGELCAIARWKSPRPAARSSAW